MKEFSEITTINAHYYCKYMGECCSRHVIHSKEVEMTAESATDDTLNCRSKYGGNKNLTHPFIPTLWCSVNCFDNSACTSNKHNQYHQTKITFEYKHYVDLKNFRMTLVQQKQMEQDRQRTYTQNTVVHSHNHCCLGKAMNMTYSECVSVAWAIQHTKQMPLLHRHLCLFACTTVFHIISQMVQFLEEGYWTQNACFDFHYNFCLKHFSF